MRDRRKDERRKYDQGTIANIKAGGLLVVGLAIGLAVIPRLLDLLVLGDMSQNLLVVAAIVAYVIILFVMMYVAARIARRR